MNRRSKRRSVVKQRTRRLKRVSRKQSRRVSRKQSRRVSRKQSRRVSRKQSRRVSRKQSRRVSRKQSRRVSRNQLQKHRGIYPAIFVINLRRDQEKWNKYKDDSRFIRYSACNGIEMSRKNPYFDK